MASKPTLWLREGTNWGEMCGCCQAAGTLAQPCHVHLFAFLRWTVGGAEVANRRSFRGSARGAQPIEGSDNILVLGLEGKVWES